ncbi:MAG: S8 family serine peptidase [Actinobacteria bacterium]|nr:S8 family serine peptidase [Actinomycetota bacterium]
MRMLSALLLLTLIGPAAAVGIQSDNTALTPVIVQVRGTITGVEHAIADLGGATTGRLGIIDAIVADVPADRVDELAGTAGVVAVTTDERLQPEWTAADFDPLTKDGSLYYVAQEVTGASSYWTAGYTGAGVDVALIDTGVVEIDGLATTGKVVHGPDLSFESQSPDHTYLDTYGHGTHMAGIIAGRSNGATPTAGNTTDFLGMAPDARVVSLKVGDKTGAADVSQVIAAIDWVVQHRNRDGLNIRVLNLSYGTTSTQSWRVDPLSHAVDVAWRSGIVVVTSAGNEGNASNGLTDPAYNPNVIAVGASSSGRTYTSADDTVPSFSSCGNGIRNPDIVAPGQSVVSLRVPGSYADTYFPTAREGEMLFRGTGTSQSAAVVSGAAALVIEQRPAITPDEVKSLFKTTAQAIPSSTTLCSGDGLLDLKQARDRMTPIDQDGDGDDGDDDDGDDDGDDGDELPRHTTGDGLLESARGGYHVYAETVNADTGEITYTPLEGEMDIHGNRWDGAAWATASSAGTSWSAYGEWNGTDWTGESFTGNRWDGNRWDGNRWDGNRWDSNRWDGNRWDGNRWDGSGWDGNRWDGNRWDGNRWDDGSFDGNRWDSSWDGGTGDDGYTRLGRGFDNGRASGHVPGAAGTFGPTGWS